MAALKLNCDMGEQFGHWGDHHDDALLTLIDQANLACGFHAGDFTTMAHSVKAAVAAGVTIGAHPAYPDLQGFGRRAMQCSPQEVQDMMLYQIGALDAFCHRFDAQVDYVKPHGALYNAIADDDALLEAALVACADFRPGLALMTLARPEEERERVLSRAARLGVPVLFEAFADRAYLATGRLVPRQDANAVLASTDRMIEQARAIAAGEAFPSVDESPLRLHADTLCVHGDTPQAREVLATLRAALERDAS